MSSAGAASPSPTHMPPPGQLHPSFTPCALNVPTSLLFSSLSTFNITSSAQYSNSSARLTKLKRIKPILNAHTVSFWQETKLYAKDDGHLTPFFSQSHSLFLSNNPGNTQTDIRHHTAGIATCIANSYLSSFNPPSIYRLAPSLAGHALLLLLAHKSTGHIIALLNLRLSATDTATRTEQLAALFTNAHYPFPAHHFLAVAGDFNFNVSSDDSSHLTVPQIPAPWHGILANLNLHEIKQDLPTYLSISRPGANVATRIITSRIDRIYLSLTESHYATLSPISKILPSKLRDGVNVHLPVSLSLSPIPPTTHSHTRASIPPWTIAHKLFPSIFYALYSSGPVPVDTGLRLDYFKHTLYRTKAKIGLLSNAAMDVIHQLQISVKALRLTQTNLANSIGAAFRIRLLARSFPRLLSLVSQNLDLSWNTTLLTSFINSLYQSHGSIDPCNNHQPLHATPPLRPFDPECKAPCLAHTLKVSLPSSRARTTHLRDTLDPEYLTCPDPDQTNIHNAPLVNDPTKLQRLLRDYWGKLWARPIWPSPTSRRLAIEAHLQRYNKVIKPSLVFYPSIDIVLQALAHSGDSSVGPDGIPFSAYRALADVAGPLLLDVALLLGTNSKQLKTLKNFNVATLLLLPKDDTHLVDHQRPLGINNTDNRLIANIYLLCILGAVQDLVDPAQKMFLPGRHMTDHIRMFNDLFYTAVNQDDDFFLFFFDNVKAFDSMHHDYIHAVLGKQGFPLWFLHAVANLFDNATLIPTLAPDARIAFLKGVKQGCPLSPVIFILIYDVLITFLKDSAPPETWVAGAADDLALGARRLQDLLPFLPIIDSFSEASGLRINRSKTGLLSTRPSRISRTIPPPTTHAVHDIRHHLMPPPTVPWRPSPSARAHAAVLATSAWPNVSLLDRHKYLGITFANPHINNKTLLGEIFQPALTKALKRLRLYQRSLSFMPLHHRIISINTFVTPLFSYLISFYIIPVDLYLRYRVAVKNAIVPFHGTSIAYEHLVVPPTLMGPATPLHDLWILTATRLLWPLITTITVFTTPWGFQSGRPQGIYFFSPLIQDHCSLLLMEILGPNYLDWARQPTIQLDELTKKSFKMMLITSAFHKWKGRESSQRTSAIYAGTNRQILLRERFAKYGDGDFLHALAHFEHIHHGPNQRRLLTHHIKCYTNALTTHHRLNRAHISTTSTILHTTPANPFPCYLCPNGTDHIQHLYRDCATLTDTLALLAATGILDSSFHSALRCSITSGNPTYHLSFPPDSHRPGHRLHLTLCLNLAIWLARNRFMSAGGRFGPTSPPALIASLTVTLLFPPSTSPIHKMTKARNLAAFLSLLHSPNIRPTDALVFTDGGAKPSPGPCGAGALIVHSTLVDKSDLLANPHTRLLCALGLGSSIYAGYYAVGAASQFLIDHPIDPAPTGYHFFHDSISVLRGLTSLTKNPCYIALTRTAKKLISLISPRHHYLIGGHSGNPGGDIVRALASRGALESARGRPLPIPSGPTELFLYHKLPP